MNYFYITGTSKGIGKAIAEELLLDENNVIFGAARSNTIKHHHYNHQNIDLSDINAVLRMKHMQHDDAEKIVLINNAATLGEIKHYGDLTPEGIVRSYNLNVIVPALLMNNFIDTYRDTPCEKIIINLSSGAATSPYDGWSVYCSSKAALDMMTKVGDAEQNLPGVKYPVTILGVAPGVVETGMQQSIREADDSGFSRRQKFIELKENNQLYDTEDVAKRFVQIINNPSSTEGVISRITL